MRIATPDIIESISVSVSSFAPSTDNTVESADDEMAPSDRTWTPAPSSDAPSEPDELADDTDTDDDDDADHYAEYRHTDTRRTCSRTQSSGF